MAGATASPALALALASPAAPAGVPLPVLIALVGGIVAMGVVVLILAMRRGRKPRRVLCGKCRRVVLPEWEKCRFCKAQLREPREAVLEFVSGPLLGQRLGLERDVTTMQRAATTNTVHLIDNGVSRKHIGIKRLDGEYELADLGSTNGVYVNGERVARRKLALGDVIRVGTTEMVFKS